MIFPLRSDFHGYTRLSSLMLKVSSQSSWQHLISTQTEVVIKININSVNVTLFSWLDPAVVIGVLLGGLRTLGIEDAAFGRHAFMYVTIHRSSLLKSLSDPWRGSEFIEAINNRRRRRTRQTSLKCAHSFNEQAFRVCVICAHYRSYWKPATYNCPILFSAQVLLVRGELLV